MSSLRARYFLLPLLAHCMHAAGADLSAQLILPLLVVGLSLVPSLAVLVPVVLRDTHHSVLGGKSGTCLLIQDANAGSSPLCHHAGLERILRWRLSPELPYKEDAAG